LHDFELKIGFAKGALKIMAWTKVQTTIVGAVIVAMAAYSIMEHQGQERLREQNELLRKQMAQLQADNDRFSAQSRERMPHLPAPQMQPGPAAAASEDLVATNLYERFKEKSEMLTAEQVDAFLKANGRRASSLLAAYRTSHDLGLLREAMGKYPEDPQVAFEAVTSPWLSADEKRPWLKTFEQTDPENSLANYLSAIDDFKSGRTDEAIRELAGTSGKRLDDYTQTRIQDDADVYLSAGYSAAEADMASTESVILPQLAPLKQLGQQLVDLANSYNQAGDSASAQSALQMALRLGQSLDTSQSSTPVLISQLVGLAVERMALGAMDPNASIGNGQTVQDELDRIAQNKQTIHALNSQSQPLMQNLTDQDWVNFTNRRLLFGEAAAMRWVLNKYGQQ
jgi:hypothetical protein